MCICRVVVVVSLVGVRRVVLRTNRPDWWSVKDRFTSTNKPNQKKRKEKRTGERMKDEKRGSDKNRRPSCPNTIRPFNLVHLTLLCRVVHGFITRHKS